MVVYPCVFVCVHLEMNIDVSVLACVFDIRMARAPTRAFVLQLLHGDTLSQLNFVACAVLDVLIRCKDLLDEGTRTFDWRSAYYPLTTHQLAPIHPLALPSRLQRLATMTSGALNKGLIRCHAAPRSAS